MKVKLTIILTVLISTILFGQKTDSLTFFSSAFQHDRTVYIKTPDFYKYQSDSVKLPVIYILDGQHEWFVNPILSAIKYLQYTHEIPQALVVVIPLTDRKVECSLTNLHSDTLALHKFITRELNEQLESYQPSDYKILVGHSFSASFALYSHLLNPVYYSAVIANSPFDSFEELVLAFDENKQTDKSKISISIGGSALDKDYYHRRQYDNLKSKYPAFFNAITLFEADNSAHNAVPIVAIPYLLTKNFDKFRSRYSEIAKVNSEYKLINEPESINYEIKKIVTASRIGNYFYVPEIADINGLASRYLGSGFNEYGISIYELGIKYYPEYFEFHLALYELLLPINITKAKWHLNKAYDLLQKLEVELPERQEILDQLSEEKKKNNW